MRIISGKFRGRNLVKSDHLKSLRPTTDKNRETLFNILSFGKFGFCLRDSKILDLCCGSGAIGFEALSRGAGFVTFIDNNRDHLELLKQNITLLKVESDCEVICADARNLYPFHLKKPNYDEAFLRKNCDGECGLYQVIQPNSPSKFLPKRRSQRSASSGGMGITQAKKLFDLVFLDPPYDQDSLPMIQNLLEKNFISENTLLVIEEKSEKEPKNFLPLKLLESRKYGSTTFIFLKK